MKLKWRLLVVLVLGISFLVPTVAFAEDGPNLNKDSSIGEIDNAIFEKYPDAKKWMWDDDPSDSVYELAEGGASPYQKGAVLVTSDALGSSLGSLGHAAISYNNSKNVSSFISSGVKLYNNSSFGNKYKKWGSVYPNSTGTAVKAADQAYRYRNRPYNINLVNKTRTDKFYCSQLVWRGYKNAGLDLGITSSFVAPRQLWDSNKFPKTIVNRGMPRR